MDKVLMVALLLLSPLCNGAGYYQITPEERQLCNSMFGANALRDHLCDCVRNYNRAAREVKWEEIKYYADDAVSSCTYFMIRHKENKGDPIDQQYPTAQMYRGMARVLQRDRTNALLDLSDAVLRNPGMLAAYIHLSELHSNMGNKQKALEYVTEGLKHQPSSKQLQRRYLKLGGKEPFPIPYQKGPEKSQQQTNQQSTKRTSENIEGVNQRTQSIEYEPITLPPSRASDVDNRPIGSTTNPWCRFCPDTPAKADPLPSNP